MNFTKSAETEGLQFCKNILAGVEANPHSRNDWFNLISLFATEKFTDYQHLRTAEQRFSKALDTPFGTAAFAVLKLSPGSEIEVPEAPEEPLAKSAGPANARISELANLHRQRFPNLSSEAAFTEIWTSRENLSLKTEAVKEIAALRDDDARFGAMRRQLGFDTPSQRGA